MSFFGFDAVLPERRDRDGAFPDQQDLFAGGDLGAKEDIAVYTWGADDYDGLGQGLVENGDDANDETFGGGKVGKDFQFAHQAQQDAGFFGTPAKQGKAAHGAGGSGKRQSGADPFATSEADFFSTGTRKSTRFGRSGAQATSTVNPSKSLSSVAEPSQRMPASVIAPNLVSTGSQPRMKTLEEIEAEMLGGGGNIPVAQNAVALQVPPVLTQATQPLTMEELERDMLTHMAFSQAPQGHQQPQGPAFGQYPPVSQGPQSAPGMSAIASSILAPPPPANEAQHQQQQQQMLSTMFPPLGYPSKSADGRPGLLGQEQGSFSQRQGPQGQEAISLELERKIMETEILEAKRRRKAMKIAGMSKYNDIMTGGDKEFITRIQLSQLVTPDPYASDFYAQVYSQIARQRALQSGPAALGGSGGASVPGVLPVGKDGRGLAVGVVRNQQKKLKDGAMQRMTMQVKRIVENAKERSAKAPAPSLQHALGRNKLKTSITAPRPTLQVTRNATETAASISNLLNTASAAPGAPSVGRRQPLTRKQVMLRIEELYEMVLELEQTRRDQPAPPIGQDQIQEAIEAGLSVEEIEERNGRAGEWSKRYEAQVEHMWLALMVQEPLEISNPHPFISLLGPLKGHRVFGRLMRHIDPPRQLISVILILACFPQLDVVARPPPVTSTAIAVSQYAAQEAADRQAKVKQTESFLSGVIPFIVSVIGRLELKMVAGMLSLCCERWDVGKVLMTRPGVALFTILLSRAEMLKHVTVPLPDGTQPATPLDVEQWTASYLGFLRLILPTLQNIFPSSQAQASAFGPSAMLGMGVGGGAVLDPREEREGLALDGLDGECWGLAATMALLAPSDEQTALISGLREKILHTVHSAKKGWVSPLRAELRLKAVNLLLNGLGLDATMIEG